METKKVIRELAIVMFHAVSLIYLALIWETLPVEVPVHFNIHGEADDWTSKMGLLYILLAYNGLLYILFLLIPKLAAKKFLQKNPGVFQKLRFGLTFVFGSIGFILVYMSTGDSKVGIMCLGIVFAVMSIFLGNYLQTVKPNYLVGIRTPWTLENEKVWRKTHQFGGKMLFWGGLLSIPFIFILPMELSPFPPVGVLVISMLVAMVYSYRIFRKEQTVEE